MAVGHPKSVITSFCNYTKNENIFANVSSAQHVLVAHTYELFHTAFICMKYEWYKKRSHTPCFGSRGASA